MHCKYFVTVELRSLHLYGSQLDMRDLAHLEPCSTLLELSIGPCYSSMEFQTEALRPIFERLETLRVGLPSSSPLPSSNALLLDSVLSLLDPLRLICLSISILGSDIVPWAQFRTDFVKLRFLRVSKLGEVSDDEIAQFQAYLDGESVLESLHIDLRSVEVEKVIEKKAENLERLHPLLRGIFTGSNHSEDEVEPIYKSKNEDWRKEGEDWRPWARIVSFMAPVACEPEYLHLIPRKYTIANVERWMRHFRYAAMRIETIAAKMRELHHSLLVSRREMEVLAHPYFIPIIAQAMRLNGKSMDLWAALVPPLAALFGNLTTLARSETSGTSNGSNPFSSQFVNQVEGQTNGNEEVEKKRGEEKALEESEKEERMPWSESRYAEGRSPSFLKSMGLRALIFENMAPIVEGAIEEFGLEGEEFKEMRLTSHSQGLAANLGEKLTRENVSEMLRNRIGREETKEERKRRANLDLMRFIATVARHAPNDVYPEKFNMARSEEIVKYCMREWYEGYESGDEYGASFVSPFLARLKTNPSFVHRMHDLGFANYLEAVVDKWHVVNTEGLTTKVFSSLGNLPSLASLMTPSHVSHLLLHRHPLISKIFNTISIDTREVWLDLIWAIATAHGQLISDPWSDQPTPYCEELVTHLLKAAPVFAGEFTSQLSIYSGSFCPHCRLLFASGVSHLTQDKSIPTGLQFMAKRGVSERADFLKPVFSWVVEEKGRVQRWLTQLQVLLNANGWLARHNWTIRWNTMEFFVSLSDLLWRAAEDAVDTCEPFIAEHRDFRGQQAWETAAIASQSPVFVDLKFERIPPFINSLFVRLGNPTSAFSVLYHTLCFRGRDLVLSLEQQRVNGARNSGGGRRLNSSSSYPTRLFPPLHLSTSSQGQASEDLLSLVAESLVASLVLTDPGFLFLITRSLCNLSYYHSSLRDRLRSSPLVSTILAHVLTGTASLGGTTAILSLATELFGSLDSIDLNPSHFVSTPLAKALVNIYETVAEASVSGHPWWEAALVFLLRSTFRRALPLVLGISTSSLCTSSSFTLNQRQIDQIFFLTDVMMNLSQLQDITSQQTAFAALYDALYIPDESQDPYYFATPIHRLVHISCAALVVARIKERHSEKFLKSVTTELFGFVSAAEKAYFLYLKLSGNDHKK